MSLANPHRRYKKMKFFKRITKREAVALIILCIFAVIAIFYFYKNPIAGHYSAGSVGPSVYSSSQSVHGTSTNNGADYTESFSECPFYVPDGSHYRDCILGLLAKEKAKFDWDLMFTNKSTLIARTTRTSRLIGTPLAGLIPTMPAFCINWSRLNSGYVNL